MPAKLSIMILILAAFAFAQTANEEASQKEEIKPMGPQPRIVCPEQRFDFGYAPEGFYLVHDYIIKNEGQEELKIQRVQTTCGCTNAPTKKMQLKPGEETTITVIFNNTHYKSLATKGTIITSNDPIDPSIRVTFTANMDSVGFPFRISPWGLDIPQGSDPPKIMNFEIQNNDTIAVELKVIDWTKDVLEQPKLKKDTLQPNEKVSLEMSMDSDFDYAVNFIKASVTLETEGTSPIRFTIPIKGAGPK